MSDPFTTVSLYLALVGLPWSGQSDSTDPGTPGAASVHALRATQAITLDGALSEASSHVISQSAM